MLDLIKKANLNFEIPEDIASAIHELEKGIEEKVSYVDCLQDEIRNLAHCSVDYDLTFEQSEKIIDYFCRKRWL